MHRGSEPIGIGDRILRSEADRQSVRLAFFLGAAVRLSARREWELMMTDHYKSDDEIRSLVNEFETCSFHPSEFKHYQHLAVALWYVANLSYADASERMKRGIQRLAASYGKTGYHETITVFWLRVVRGFLTGSAGVDSIAVLANQLIEKYAEKNLILDYYSTELLASTEAKSDWVEPDLKPLLSLD